MRGAAVAAMRHLTAQQRSLREALERLAPVVAAGDPSGCPEANNQLRLRVRRSEAHRHPDQGALFSMSHQGHACIVCNARTACKCSPKFNTVASFASRAS